MTDQIGLSQVLHMDPLLFGLVDLQETPRKTMLLIEVLDPLFLLFHARLRCPLYSLLLLLPK